jgi:peptide/nickel transport system substrate-binding protein
MSSSRIFRLIVGLALLALFIWFARGAWSTGPTGTPQDTVAGAERRGGTLRATYSTEPTNFLRFADATTGANLMVSLLTQDTLVRALPNGELEARLAESWSPSEDGLTWALKLRPELRFSDGAPLTSADVVFSVRAALASASAGDLKVGEAPVTVRALDAQRLVIIFPVPYGPGLAMFDQVPILPSHKLQTALDTGTLLTAWAASTPVSEVVGAGPFIFQEYSPGQRLRFVRNPHFHGLDASGTALPYLDGIDMAIVPEHSAEILRLQAGDTDVTTDRVFADDLAGLQQAETTGTVQVVDAGPLLDVSTFWFNLKPGAPAGTSRPWLVAPEFRRAISHAVNRQAIVDTVFLGEAVPAYGPVTAGFGRWMAPDLPITEFDLTRARTLLTSIGLTDRDGDGILDDAAGQPVRFSVITRSGQPERERTMAVVQEQLRPVGVRMDIVGLAAGDIIRRFGEGDSDAIYFGTRITTMDPIGSMSFWTSSGPMHFWNPGQASPATEWEARIDTLMRQQAATVDVAQRRRLFHEAQQILAVELPALWFVAPRYTVAVSSRLRGVTPRIFFPPILWNAEQLWLADGGR